MPNELKQLLEEFKTETKYIVLHKIIRFTFEKYQNKGILPKETSLKSIFDTADFIDALAYEFQCVGCLTEKDIKKAPLFQKVPKVLIDAGFVDETSQQYAMVIKTAMTKAISNETLTPPEILFASQLSLKKLSLKKSNPEKLSSLIKNQKALQPMENPLLNSVEKSTATLPQAKKLDRSCLSFFRKRPLSIALEMEIEEKFIHARRKLEDLSEKYADYIWKKLKKKDNNKAKVSDCHTRYQAIQSALEMLDALKEKDQWKSTLETLTQLIKKCEVYNTPFKHKSLAYRIFSHFGLTKSNEKNYQKKSKVIKPNFSIFSTSLQGYCENKWQEALDRRRAGFHPNPFDNQLVDKRTGEKAPTGTLYGTPGYVLASKWKPSCYRLINEKTGELLRLNTPQRIPGYVTLTTWKRHQHLVDKETGEEAPKGTKHGTAGYILLETWKNRGPLVDMSGKPAPDGTLFGTPGYISLKRWQRKQTNTESSSAYDENRGEKEVPLSHVEDSHKNQALFFNDASSLKRLLPMSDLENDNKSLFQTNQIPYKMIKPEDDFSSNALPSQYQ